MLLRNHSTDFLGERPQSVGQGDKISIILNPFSSIWYLKDFSIIFFVFKRFFTESKDVLAIKETPSMVASISATWRGWPVVLLSLPFGVVVVFCSSNVVGAICPPVMPYVALLIKITVIFSPLFAA